MDDSTFTFATPRTTEPRGSRRPPRAPVTGLRSTAAMQSFSYGAIGYVAQRSGRQTPDGAQLLRNPDPIPWLVENFQYREYVYADMLNKDGKLGGLWRKMERYVLALPWRVQPPKDPTDDHIARAQLVDDVIRNAPGRRDAFKQLLNGHWEGRAGVQPQWVEDPTASRWTWGVAGFADIGPMELWYDDQGRAWFLRHALDTPQPLEIGPDVIILRRNPTRLNPYATGYGRATFFNYLLKKDGGTKAWAYFNEKYGSPTVKGGYRPGSGGPVDPGEIAQFGSDLAAMLGMGVLTYDMEKFEVGFLEAQKYGTVNTYKDFIEFLDLQNAQAITGETLSSAPASHGNMSSARLHGDVLLGAVQDLAASLSEVLTEQFARWVEYYNCGEPADGRWCEFHIDAEPEADKLELAKLYAAVQGMGLQLGAKQMRKVFDIGELGTDDTPLVPTGPAQLGATPPTPGDEAGLATFARHPARPADHHVGQDAEREAIVGRATGALARVTQEYRAALVAEELPSGKA